MITTPLLPRPVSLFTDHIEAKFGKIQHYTFSEDSPRFWEDESVVLFVKSGSGRIDINGKMYPLSCGSICMLHEIHIPHIAGSGASFGNGRDHPDYMRKWIYGYHFSKDAGTLCFDL